MAEGNNDYPADRIDVEEIDDYAMMIRNPATGQTIRVYPDGQIEGMPDGFTVVDNRIPGLVAQAAELGYSEALSRIADARQRLFTSMVGPFRR